MPIENSTPDTNKKGAEQEMQKVVIALQRIQKELQKEDKSPEEQEKLAKEAAELSDKMAKLEEKIEKIEKELKVLTDPNSEDFKSGKNDEKIQQAQKNIDDLSQDKMRAFFQKLDGEGRFHQEDNTLTIYCHNQEQFDEACKEIAQDYKRRNIEYETEQAEINENGQTYHVTSFVTKIRARGDKKDAKQEEKSPQNSATAENKEGEEKDDAEKMHPTQKQTQAGRVGEAEGKIKDEPIAEESKKVASRAKENFGIENAKPAASAEEEPQANEGFWAKYAKTPENERETKSAAPPHGLHPAHLRGKN